MSKVRSIVLCLFFLTFALTVNAQEIEVIAGFEFSPFLSGSSNYGWELFSVYPAVGLQWGIFRLSGFAGGGLSAGIESHTTVETYGAVTDTTTEDSLEWTWTYGFGGNLEVLFDTWTIGLGGGMAGPNRVDSGEILYPFVRVSLGMSFGDYGGAKLFYDHSFDNGFKFGILFSSYFPLFTLGHTPPAPKPAPRPTPQPTPKPVLQKCDEVFIDPPIRNIDPPKVREVYKVPVTSTLNGRYSTYEVTEHDIAGKSDNWQLNKSTILDWLDLNKNNTDFCNALTICMIIADGYEYDRGTFLCVDYSAMFILMDELYNKGSLENKTWARVDDNHIWLWLNIPNRYRDGNGTIRQSEYLWVDPTWFDNDRAYNFNFFTWGLDYVPQFMEQRSGDGDQCHKYFRKITWNNQGHVVKGMTYSIVYENGRYRAVKDDFGRRKTDTDWRK